MNTNTTEVLSVQENLYDRNLFAYCDNNPITRNDPYGYFGMFLTTALVGAGVNIITTFIAAKATCQEYKLIDVVVAGTSGFVNAIPFVGKNIFRNNKWWLCRGFKL